MNKTETLPFTLRTAERRDLAELVRLIHELARHQKLEAYCHPDEKRLAEHLFGLRPYAEALIAEVEGRAAGFALFFHNYSTFMTRPGIYLEDLFVEEGHRGLGIGKALMVELMRIAARRDCGRVEWQALDWNLPAISFYRHVFGAEPIKDASVYRVSREGFMKWVTPAGVED